MATRLWDKGQASDELILQFTVGEDPILDLRLLQFDIFGSAAHVHTLKSGGILSQEESAALLGELENLYRLSLSNKIKIPVELEDCHTTIEAALTEKLGDTGKKIHCARSRNDQVLTAFRLMMRAKLLQHLQRVEEIVDALSFRQSELFDLPLPGYTHFQRAMPSSFGMWLGAYVEFFLEQLRSGLQLYEQLDCYPLGVGSGFGIPLELSRSIGADKLAFSRIQRNPVYVISSRGVHELQFLNWLKGIAGVIEKFAADVMLFTTSEFGFLSLPDALTTGSSIMPQKRNPDVVELLRGSAAEMRAAAYEVEEVISKLPSSYHREMQLIKKPFFRAIDAVDRTVPVFIKTVLSMIPNTGKLSIKDPELLATYEAYRLVSDGVPFRDAYKRAAESFAGGSLDLDLLLKGFDLVQKKIKVETTEARQELDGLKSFTEKLRKRLNRIPDEIFHCE